GQPSCGYWVHELRGLSDEDALALWYASGVSGSREELLETFNSFGNHALLIQLLASAVANYTPAPGNFDRWRQDNPDFNPLIRDLKKRGTHVLEFAMRGLDGPAGVVLRTVALFHAPASYDALHAILVGGGKPFHDVEALSGALLDLVNRSLLGWDKPHNRYDMHPLVRLHVQGSLNPETLRETFAARLPYFEQRPVPSARRDVQRLEDLNDTIELYHTYIGLGDYDKAARVFTSRLSRAMLYRLSVSCYGVMLLKRLFPGGMGHPPGVTDPTLQAKVYNFLATAYFMSGQLGRAAALYRCQINIGEREGAMRQACIGWRSLAEVLRLSGELREAEAAVRHSAVIARDYNDPFQKASTLRVWGSVLTALGRHEEAQKALETARPMFRAQNQPQSEGLVCASLSHLKLLAGEAEEALALAGCALKLAENKNRFERDFIRGIRLEGQAELALGKLAPAEERLWLALKRARAVNWVREEIPAAAGLAEAARRRGDFNAARELLRGVLRASERGPYRLSHAHARNILAQVERDAGDAAAAVEEAARAYELAWCDGPPYAYRRGLAAASAHLAALGAPEPQLPPFDESKFKPLPEVEIDQLGVTGDHPDEDEDEGLE
ncbi:MAG: tetratricopeptide repeat protein, partial [Acidobacteriota bacterium]|nr:tetratricopeptide repeat protein [Acidobacteriota bacterium]